jgi:hypothetical protein
MRANKKTTIILLVTAASLVTLLVASEKVKPFAGKGEDYEKVVQQRMAAEQKERSALTASRQTASPADLLKGVSAAETATKAGEDEGAKTIKKSLTSPTSLLLNPSPRVTTVPLNSAATNAHWYDEQHALNQPEKK